jgi:DNA repair protein REV1
MLLARLATKKAKPDGQFALCAAEAEAYVAQLPVGDLPGVGRKLRRKLTALGIVTCADVLSCGKDLRKEVGDKTGAQLKEFAAGLVFWASHCQIPRVCAFMLSYLLVTC